MEITLPWLLYRSRWTYFRHGFLIFSFQTIWILTKLHLSLSLQANRFIYWRTWIRWSSGAARRVKHSAPGVISEQPKHERCQSLGNCNCNCNWIWINSKRSSVSGCPTVTSNCCGRGARVASAQAEICEELEEQTEAEAGGQQVQDPTIPFAGEQPEQPGQQPEWSPGSGQGSGEGTGPGESQQREFRATADALICVLE